MPILRKVIETAVRFVPDKAPDPLIEHHQAIGRPLDRVDGALKVSGAATFAAEFQLANMAHAALVFSAIARGRAIAIDTAEAAAAPGVIAVITHKNAPKLKAPTLLNINQVGKGVGGSDLPILQTDEIHYDGEPLAVVVAESLEQAEYAASLVHIAYAAAEPRASFTALLGEAIVPHDVLGEEPEVSRGDAAAALAAAPYRVDHVYHTPRENQNALETHATIAAWEDDGHLTVFEPTQFVNGLKHQLAHVLGLKADHVRVLSPFVGGGFGGKVALWSYSVICAVAARETGRPVKLALSREGVFRVVGGRTLAEQRVALGANEYGQFTTLIHTGTTATTTHANYPEQFSLYPRHMYSATNAEIGQKVVNLDTVANTWMRAPGEAMATFALESAIDELAWTLKMDPVDLRRLNEPAQDPTKGIPFSSRHLVEAYQRGAEAFGWAERSRPPRSQRDGAWLIGQGVATAFYPHFRWPAKAKVRLYADNTALVEAAASEMGMGIATVQIQQAADRLGLPVEQVAFRYGDSELPDSPIMAGGSSQTITVAAAVQPAVEKLHKELLKLAGEGSPLGNADLDEVEARNGGLFCKGQPTQGETYGEILRRAGKAFIEAEGSSGLPFEFLKYSMGSYGAQFCEVRVHEDTGETRVSRWTGAFDCGRIINPKTATSQIRGGIVMGIGMALQEETVFDERRGRIVTRSLAEYHVPVHLDIPQEIKVIFLDIPDDLAPLGARGVGEIGATGCAAAIANAIYHATGTRIRELPITLDKLM
ncbi:MAG: xanthine dehydrogenase family protein molybdopterin-binding subunit [Thermomicrobiales bacterium]